MYLNESLGRQGHLCWKQGHQDRLGPGSLGEGHDPETGPLYMVGGGEGSRSVCMWGVSFMCLLLPRTAAAVTSPMDTDFLSGPFLSLIVLLLGCEIYCEVTYSQENPQPSASTRPGFSEQQDLAMVSF